MTLDLLLIFWLCLFFRNQFSPSQTSDANCFRIFYFTYRMMLMCFAYSTHLTRDCLLSAQSLWKFEASFQEWSSGAKLMCLCLRSKSEVELFHFPGNRTRLPHTCGSNWSSIWKSAIVCYRRFISQQSIPTAWQCCRRTISMDIVIILLNNPDWQ